MSDPDSRFVLHYEDAMWKDLETIITGVKDVLFTLHKPFDSIFKKDCIMHTPMTKVMAL